MTSPCCCNCYCCCCGLKGCCITIGVLSIVFGCLGVLQGGLSFKVIYEKPVEWEKPWIHEYEKPSGISKGGYIAISGVYIALNALYIGFGIFLIVGAVKKNPICCRIWIGGATILLILETIFGSIVVYYYSPEKGHMTYKGHLGCFISCLIVIYALQAYFIWVVYSYIKEIKK